MAERPVFIPCDTAPYVREACVSFAWNGGFAVSQKRKNIAALHENYLSLCPQGNVLEISSKSLTPLGVKMSAFNLMKRVPSLGTRVPVECVFQGGKVFGCGGPYTDLYTASPREAKRDPRLKESGMLTGFFYEGRHISPMPRTAFYDWLYINAIRENEEIAMQVICYDAFTDIEFNPKKSLNCQARAAALYVALERKGLLDRCVDYDEYLRVIGSGE